MAALRGRRELRVDHGDRASSAKLPALERRHDRVALHHRERTEVRHQRTEILVRDRLCPQSKSRKRLTPH